MEIKYDSFSGIIEFGCFKWSCEAFDEMMQIFTFSQIINLMRNKKEITAIRFGKKFILSIKDNSVVCKAEITDEQ